MELEAKDEYCVVVMRNVDEMKLLKKVGKLCNKLEKERKSLRRKRKKRKEKSKKKKDEQQKKNHLMFEYEFVRL